jgi:hypothetical protein
MHRSRPAWDFKQRLVVATCVLLAAAFSCPSPAVAAPGDIVLYSADVTTIRGYWARIAAATGAGGQLMASSNRGWSATTAPLAAPHDYFQVSFRALANTPYPVWLRLRAPNNVRNADSVWVQFNDALNTTGSAVWRIGSTSALRVNLEACSGCGISGWGWSDGDWRTGDYPVVKFASTGTHTLRVQTREDGVQIDQIVLSPTAYFYAAPGTASNDTTIVPKGTTSTASTAPEIVLYASETVRGSGNWVLKGDTTAAYGLANRNYDYAAPLVSVPLSTPADFIEWTFRAVAGTRYKTWIRLRAANNSTQNSSVWVQFSDTVNAGGVPVYRIGTTSALAVALEACAGCALSGWGWQNKHWAKGDTGDVYFPTSGTKKMRIQAREDGVRIDQIVLSPMKFLNTRPGAVRDDSTLVNRDGTRTAISTTSTTGSTSTSYPKTLTFTASADHNTLVMSYKLEVFTAGTNPATATPAGTLNLGKPPIVGGQISADIGVTVQALASGSYFATVSAVGSASSSRSAPTSPFTR